MDEKVKFILFSLFYLVCFNRFFDFLTLTYVKAYFNFR
jgi:hypothetical protein